MAKNALYNTYVQNIWFCSRLLTRMWHHITAADHVVEDEGKADEGIADC